MAGKGLRILLLMLKFFPLTKHTKSCWESRSYCTFPFWRVFCSASDVFLVFQPFALYVSLTSDRVFVVSYSGYSLQEAWSRNISAPNIGLVS